MGDSREHRDSGERLTCGTKNGITAITAGDHRDQDARDKKSHTYTFPNNAGNSG